MRARKLSGRLEAMASFVSDGEKIADIGADHGYLSFYLVREGVCPFAILTDVRKGPLEKTRLSAEKAFKISAGIDTKIELRQGDGLFALEEAEVDAVVIAGMGGETIISILSADPKKTKSFNKFILQPRTKTEPLKEWLECECWNIITETSAEERGRMCDIIVCAPMKKTSEGEDDRQGRPS